MPIRAIVYTSRALPGLCNSKVEVITENAVYFNQLAGVTGVMLYDGVRFLQYIEGPPDGVVAVYERIRGSASHAGLVELADEQHLPARLFPFWAMRQLPINALTMGRVLMADWSGFALSAAGHRLDGTAIDHLRSIIAEYDIAA